MAIAAPAPMKTHRETPPHGFPRVEARVAMEVF
jgi:hypothetical protein